MLAALAVEAASQSVAPESASLSAVRRVLEITGCASLNLWAGGTAEFTASLSPPIGRFTEIPR